MKVWPINAAGGARTLQRVRNRWRKLRSGLTLFGENISPEVPNDLYQAHLSIYEFFAGFCAGKRVLDVGCGAGYGTAHLAPHASSILGIDFDRRNVRYARRRFPTIPFEVADAQSLPTTLGQFDLAVSSNVFEHLLDPAAAIASASRTAPLFLLAVPPIVDAHSLAMNDAIPYHRSNLYVTEWHSLLVRHFSHVRYYVHRASVPLDFNDPFPSRVGPTDFTFTEIDAGRAMEEWTLTAVFVAEK
ncbi:MAG: class I SAM-dependent methyltransferase [Acidobacteria bacterium]|nr:class I SAM-dependent methyltransferase [Acidobacteriota bacterium]